MINSVLMIKMGLMINVGQPGWLIVALLSILVAVWIWFEPPGGRLRRLAAGPGGGHRVQLRFPTALRAREDAWPWRQRGLASGAVAVAGGWLIFDQGGVWRWIACGVAILSAVVGFIVLGKFESANSARSRREMILELPHAYELLSVCLAAGLPLRSATRQVVAALDGPVGVQLQRVLTNLDLGFGEGEAWRSLRDHPQLGRAAVDLARSADSGTMMIETLRHHAQQARRQRQAELEARAKTVGVSSVLPLMVCFLPAFFLIGIIPTVVSAMRAALL